MKWINDYLSELYFLVSEMAPYLLLGFLFAGLLKVYWPQKSIQRSLGKSGFRSALNASLIGIPMPLCSCGVIPTGVSLYKNGASKSATTSFLISTPQTGVDSIFATYSLLGLPFAIIRPIVALITGVVGGLFSSFADKNQLDHSVPNKQKSGTEQEKQTSVEKFKTIFRYGFGELVEDIVKWLVIGLLAAALISVLVPDEFFSRYMGNPMLEMLIILAASIPLYICATGSIPLAAVLLLKGISPGAALVLLMAGPATNVATMTVVGRTMGRKALLIYMLTIISGALISGMLVNWLMPASWFSIGHLHDHTHSLLPAWLLTASTIILIVLTLLAFYNRYLNKKGDKMTSDHVNTENFTILHIEGMTCHHCQASVEKNLGQLDGVESVDVNLTTGTARVIGNFDLNTAEKKIEDLGYKFKQADF